MLVTGSAYDLARIWDVDTGGLVRTLSGAGGDVYTVAWSADGSRIATGAQDTIVRLYAAPDPNVREHSLRARTLVSVSR